HRLRRAEGPVEGERRERPDGARGRDDGHGRQAARRDRATEPRALRLDAAEDPLGQGAAPVDPGAVRTTRSGRPDDDRGSGRARAGAAGGRHHGLTPRLDAWSRFPGLTSRSMSPADLAFAARRGVEYLLLPPAAPLLLIAIGLAWSRRRSQAGRVLASI